VEEWREKPGTCKLDVATENVMNAQQLIRWLRPLGALGALLLSCRADAAGEIRHLGIGGHPRVYKVEALGPEPAVGASRPIIIELHGVGADVRDPNASRFFPNFSTVVGMPPVLLVRPQGANRNWDTIPIDVADWRRLSGTDGVPVDDIGFLRAVLLDVAAKDGGDPNRAVLYGTSAGGYMTTRLTCEMADSFRAIGNLIATSLRYQLEACPKGKPIPYLLLMSKTDPVNPYGGFKRNGGNDLISAEDTVAHFARRNGCRAVREDAVPSIDNNDTSTATIVRHGECVGDAEVLFYRLDGAGHALPSRIRYDSDRDNKINRNLETAQELWKFFARHLGL
jgi:polyhydroxybutyrate depolymerase